VAATRYTRGEVLFLLSLTHEQAIDLDAFPRDSCAGLSDDDISSGGGGDDEPLYVIARWTDVQRVKRLVVREKESLAVLQLRTSGFSESEIARLSGRDRLAVRRRWHATVDEILERLGGAREDDSVVSIVSACLKCGLHPRVRLAAVKRRVRGGWKVIQDERQASVCAGCITAELRPRMLRESAAAA
jgi:hypothetical protein